MTPFSSEAPTLTIETIGPAETLWSLERWIDANHWESTEYRSNWTVEAVRSGKSRFRAFRAFTGPLAVERSDHARAGRLISCHLAQPGESHTSAVLTLCPAALSRWLEEANQTTFL
jgi:hypothetical protein